MRLGSFAAVSASKASRLPKSPGAAQGNEIQINISSEESSAQTILSMSEGSLNFLDNLVWF
jgi:hypothetical protein